MRRLSQYSKQRDLVNEIGYKYVINETIKEKIGQFLNNT